MNGVETPSQEQAGDEIARLRAEVAALRETNRRLNRRLSGEESEWMSRAMKAEREIEWHRQHWKQEFDRYLNAANELRIIYILVERARGRPVPKFNSVSDLGCGKRPDPPGSVWAHVYIDPIRGGIRSERVVDAVRDVLGLKEVPT